METELKGHKKIFASIWAKTVRGGGRGGRGVEDVTNPVC